MDITVNNFIPSGSIRAIASKSYAHRAFICAALSDSPNFINITSSSSDIDATIGCLRSLSAKISSNKNGYEVCPINRNMPGRNTVLDCNESGSSFRFLLPVSCALGADASFVLNGRLPDRPLSPLYEQLISHGCTLSEKGSNPFMTKGTLHSGDYILSKSVSSQFASGLLLALPILSGDSTIRLLGPIESVNYIDMTVDVLRKYDITVEYSNNTFFIKGGQQYHSPKSIDIEGDWSNAAFWLCAGALSKKGVTCTNLDMDSLQGDKKIIELLSRFGAKVVKGDTYVTVSRDTLKGIELDASNIPDLVPVLALMASVSYGVTEIKNAGRLRAKESDRLKSISETLKVLGADIKETDDGLVIKGQEYLHGGHVDSFNDHRIAMMAAIASAVCHGPVVISDAEAVNKSYPGFFEALA
ncbi:MAG: 3-phosphoshikimate 1-carboxyvinyltransferase, partial [Clostridia bacterium]